VGYKHAVRAIVTSLLLVLVLAAPACGPSSERTPPDGGPAIGGSGPPVEGTPVVPDAGANDAGS
jgi:hypothetical protein